METVKILADKEVQTDDMKPETETEKDYEAPMNAEFELKNDTPKVIEPDNDKCV